MVTAILPSIVSLAHGAGIATTGDSSSSAIQQRMILDPRETYHSTSPSLSSELTITPARLATTPVVSTAEQGQQQREEEEEKEEEERRVPPKRLTTPSRLAGFVGFATGCGALLAVVGFLPLPVRLSSLPGVSPTQAVKQSYYVVGFIALFIAIVCSLGLRDLPESHNKDDEDRIRSHANVDNEPWSSSVQTVTSYRRALLDAVIVGFRNEHIGLGYLGGFVARSVRQWVNGFGKSIHNMLTALCRIIGLPQSAFHCSFPCTSTRISSLLVFVRPIHLAGPRR